MTRRERIGIILVLGSLAALGPFSIDMYLPGFAAIAADFGVRVSDIGYSLTSYFIGIALGQLVYGPLTDRYGRRAPLLVGLGIYVLATTGCALSPSLTVLVVTRFLMALGACVGMVASRAVVRDLFPVNEIADVFSTFMLIIAASPMLAPTIGGYVTSSMGWRIIFVILVGFAVVLLLTVFRYLPESTTPDTAVSLRPRRILAQYGAVVSDRQFRVNAALGGLEFAGLFAYVSGASFVFMHVLGLTQTQFGWVFALNACGLIAGSQINRLLLRRYSPHDLVAVCVAGQVTVGAALTVLTILHLAHVAVLVTLIMVFLLFTGTANPNAAALALAPFSSNAGSASALLGSAQMAVGALASGIVSMLASRTALPMTTTMWASAIIAALLVWSERRRTTAGLTGAVARW